MTTTPPTTAARHRRPRTGRPRSAGAPAGSIALVIARPAAAARPRAAGRGRAPALGGRAGAQRRRLPVLGVRRLLQPRVRHHERPASTSPPARTGCRSPRHSAPPASEVTGADPAPTSSSASRGWRTRPRTSAASIAASSRIWVGLAAGHPDRGRGAVHAAGEQDFWVAQAEGSGTQTLTWEPAAGQLDAGGHERRRVGRGGRSTPASARRCRPSAGSPGALLGAGPVPPADRRRSCWCSRSVVRRSGRAYTDGPYVMPSGPAPSWSPPRAGRPDHGRRRAHGDPDQHPTAGAAHRLIGAPSRAQAGYQWPPARCPP